MTSALECGPEGKEVLAQTIVIGLAIRLERTSKGRVLHVATHRWATNRRTSKLPVWSVDERGTAKRIGATAESYAAYRIPDDAVCVIRQHKSNAGYCTFYVYDLRDLKEYAVREVEDYEFGHLPFELRLPFSEFLKRYLAEEARKNGQNIRDGLRNAPN